MNRKAQAAMEFLMTYGWAILVVLVVVGALAYFGVMNPGNILPERCELQAGFYCKDYKIMSGAAGPITMNIQNGGEDITVTGVTATGTGTAIGKTCAWAGSQVLANGQSNPFSLVGAGCTTNTLSAGQKYKFDVSIAYSKTGGLAHSASGSLFARLETV